MPGPIRLIHVHIALRTPQSVKPYLDMPACIPGRIPLVDNSLEDTGPPVNTEPKLGRADSPVDINEPNNKILLKRVRADAGTSHNPSTGRAGNSSQQSHSVQGRHKGMAGTHQCFSPSGKRHPDSRPVKPSAPISSGLLWPARIVSPIALRYFNF